jgi:hypothetical protein
MCTRQRKRGNRRRSRRVPGHANATRIPPGRNRRAENGGKLVRPHQRRRHFFGKHGEHRRNLDQPSSTDNCIDQTGEKCGNCENKDIDHGNTGK